MMDKRQIKEYNKNLIKAMNGEKKKKKVKTSDLFIKDKPNKKNKKKSKY
jgi:hypothetical protein